MATSSRQQPGPACEECRTRKLRCDRKRPSCGTCTVAGTKCEVTSQLTPRGPKRGSLNALRSRIVTIEQQLREQQPEIVSLRETCVDLAGDSGRSSSGDEEQHILSNCRTSSTIELISSPQTTISKVEMLPKTPGARFIPELMRADLDQLYFDRVHPTIPMLDRSRYFTWSRKSEINEHQTSLQYAMWTLAMSVSTQFEKMRDLLYIETRQKLERLDHSQNDLDSVHIEEVQAWILITYFEFLRSNYRRGWVSAGRVFRLVQLLRLHEIDDPDVSLSIFSEDPRVVEEKRRTFWVAYCLDRLVSLSNRFPLTLNEDVICTRIPTSESELQSDHPSEVCFLSEAITMHGKNLSSPLAECAIMITAYGRALSHEQVSTIEQAYGSSCFDFWPRHEWISAILTRVMEGFSQNHPFVSVADDPMTIFTFMVAQTSIITICKTMEQLDEAQQQRSVLAENQARALQAAREIARLARDVGCFKAHAFMPVTIFLGAERLMLRRTSLQQAETQQWEDESDLRACIDALRNMQTINNLAKYYLRLLDTGELGEFQSMLSVE